MNRKVYIILFFVSVVLNCNAMEEKIANDLKPVPRLTLLSGLRLDIAQVPNNALPAELVEFLGTIEQIKSTEYYSEHDKQILLNALANGTYNEAKKQLLIKDLLNGDYKEDMSEFLLTLIENPSSLNEKENTAFKKQNEDDIVYQVVKNNHIAILAFLHELDFNIGMLIFTDYRKQTIMYAIENNNIELVSFLLKHLVVDTKTNTFRPQCGFFTAGGPSSYWKSDNNNKILINEQDSYTYTPLMLAVRDGHSEIVQLLINAGADVNKVFRGNYAKLNPILIRSIEGLFEDDITIVKILLDAGADIEAKDAANQTALMHAKKKGFKSIQQLLLEYGATKKFELGDIVTGVNNARNTVRTNVRNFIGSTTLKNLLPKKQNK